jgi:hypothetical protein
MRRLIVALVPALVLVGPAAALPAIHPTARPVGGCQVFPTDNYWNTSVRNLPVHPRSRQWMKRMDPDVDLHPDFGPSYGDGPDYGIPVTTVQHSHPRVRVRFTYADESDHVRYPLGHDTRIEGGRRSNGDRHAIIVDRGACRLYETFATRRRHGRWYAGSGATWSLGSNALRPDSWTSADAAGLPILPGLLRWKEVRARDVDHAIRFTTPVSSRWHLWPARHDAGSKDSHRFPPMGARFRLRSSYDASALSPGARAVVKAMKTYGLVLADNGSPWFFQGEQNGHWPSRVVEDLKTIPARAFQAVDTSSLMVDRDSAATH